jgi:hypothetical protein
MTPALVSMVNNAPVNATVEYSKNEVAYWTQAFQALARDADAVLEEPAPEPVRDLAGEVAAQNASMGDRLAFAAKAGEEQRLRLDAERRALAARQAGETGRLEAMQERVIQLASAGSVGPKLIVP